MYLFMYFEHPNIQILYHQNKTLVSNWQSSYFDLNIKIIREVGLRLQYVKNHQ